MTLKDRFILLDGAMGTMLQQYGVELGEHLEVLSVTNPSLLEKIHGHYIESGAKVIYTNTFGANEYKLEGTGYSVETVIDAAVQIAKRACENKDVKVALDIGPIGQLIEPAGVLRFEEAYEVFARQIRQGVASGADLIVLETMTDLYEVKAGLLAAKENSDLPVFVTMTFEKNGRTFTGCSISAMAAVVEGLGADAVGINCSLGPADVYDIVKELVKWTTLPIIVKPNAGLPNLNNDGYDVGPEEFAAEMEKIIALGVNIVGGCCGTTPEYIRQLQALVKDKTVSKRRVERISSVCTPTKTVVIDGVRIIGERINPTGKKRFKQALLENDMDYILDQAITQLEAGADILDVNVGLPEIDEPAMMRTVVKQLQSVVNLPLQIDSSDPVSIEAALRVYNGKAIVNSVNGEQKVLDSVLPVVKKYGAAVVGLTLDEKGIPNAAGDRLLIAERICNACEAHGIAREDIYIDALTLTASAQQKEVVETLKTVRLVKEKLGVKTVLGVSNISFGLPNRELINHSFLMLALANGLDLPIMNPNVESMMDAVAAFNVLYNRDENATRFVEKYTDQIPKKIETSSGMSVEYAISKGLEQEAKKAAQNLLETTDALDVVSNYLIPALDEVGTRFETGKIFLPQLIQSAQAAQRAFDAVREKLAKSGEKTVSRGGIILATVKGDIHDIGKNIVKVILENYGYDIYDLGRDVPIETILAEAAKRNIKLVGLSALMTTTLKNMEDTIRAVKAQDPDCLVMVGGAVLTEDYAKRMGADFYAKDAKQAADIAKSVFK